MYEGEIVGEYASRRHRGGARAWRCSAARRSGGCGGMSEQAGRRRRPRAGRRPEQATRRGPLRPLAAGRRCRRAGPDRGARVPRRRARRARHRAQPDQGLPGHLERDRPRVVLPGRLLPGRPAVLATRRSGSRGTSTTSTRAPTNLQQTLLLWTTLDPDGSRGRLRVPLRPVQHRRSGAVLRRRVLRDLDRLVFLGDEQLVAHRRSRSSPRRSPAPPGRASRASSRRPSAPTR